MNIFRRISQLLRSNVNSAVDKMVDPSKHIEQLIRDMEEEQRRARIELRDQVTQAKLNEKRADECERNVKRFQEHAQRAVQAGDDALALEALRRLQDAEQRLADAENALASQSQQVAGMANHIRENDRKLFQIKARKETIKAQLRMQKQEFSGTGTAFDRFDEMASQIEMSELRAEATMEVAAMDLSSQERMLEEKFTRQLPGESSIAKSELEQRLQALKANLARKEPSSS